MARLFIVHTLAIVALLLVTSCKKGAYGASPQLTTAQTFMSVSAFSSQAEIDAAFLQAVQIRTLSNFS